ncbi:MAG: DUF2997 domain-containing protein [Dehalococcoidia bacterium]|jgi:hypothetical protein
MESHELHITIDKTGKLAVEVQGVQGEGCEALAAALDALGTVESEEHTDGWNRKQRREQGVTGKVAARG